MTNTITCPICGAQAHGLVVKGSAPATLVGCDICQHSILADLARHPNIDGGATPTTPRSAPPPTLTTTA